MADNDDVQNNIPNEISDYPVSPFEGMVPSVEGAIEKCVSAPFHIAGKVASVGFGIVGKLFGW